MEDCFYCHESRKNKNVMDCMLVEESELCYESVDCSRCYNSNYLQDCKQCVDSEYCYYCIGCNNCFGCAGLSRKDFHIFNEPYSKEDYFKKLEEVKKWPREKIEKKFEEVKLKTPRVFTHQLDNIDCFGDYLNHSKNCYWCFDSYLCEDSMYIYNANLERGAKDCVDCGPIANTFERCYDIAYCGYMNDCKHCYWADYLTDCSWCSHTWDLKYCYGCVYIKNKEYQFLNEPISKDDFKRVTKKLDKDIYALGIRDFYGLVNYKT